MMISQPVTPAIAPSSKPDPSLYHGIIEMLVDGILILSVEGKWVYGNHNAYRICQQLQPRQPVPETVPPAVWQICQRFLDQEPMDLPCPAALESEVASDRSTRYRIRVRWFCLEETQRPQLLVTLEDCCQAALNRAIAEVQQFRLTARQAEVWQLHRKGYSYREIADTLFVTLNTVKRHMKDIYAKQKLVAS